MLDVFIVNFNTEGLLPSMLSACAKASDGLAVRYWVVDNASVDGSVELLRTRYPSIELQANDENVGFGRANNQMLGRTDGDFVLLLNTDAFVSSDSFLKTLKYMKTNERCGVLGVKLVGTDGSLQPSCRYFPTPWNVFLGRTGLGRFFKGTKLVDDMSWDHATVRECDWVPGCYYLIRRKVLDDVGLFDPRFFLYFEEVDHCKRVKDAGWKVVYYPDTSVIHLGGESAKSAGDLSGAGRQLSGLQIESEMLYFRKHFGFFGLVLHLMLAIIGDTYLLVKDLIKNRGWPVAAKHWKHLSMTWHLCKLTQWAKQPTR